MGRQSSHDLDALETGWQVVRYAKKKWTAAWQKTAEITSNGWKSGKEQRGDSSRYYLCARNATFCHAEHAACDVSLDGFILFMLAVCIALSRVMIGIRSRARSCNAQTCPPLGRAGRPVRQEMTPEEPEGQIDHSHRSASDIRHDSLWSFDRFLGTRFNPCAFGCLSPNAISSCSRILAPCILPLPIYSPS